MNSQTLIIRWRWIFIALAALIATTCILLGIHQLQVHRISSRLLSEARAFAAAGQTDQATQRYSDHLAVKPAGIAPLQEYAALLLQGTPDVGTLSKALKLLDSALIQGSTDPQTRMQFVRTAFQLGHFNAAYDELQRLDGGLSTSEQFTILGKCRVRSSDPELAREAFRQALQLDKTNVDAWLGLIQIEEEIAGTDEALKLAGEMQQLIPSEAAVAKAWLYLNSNRMHEAGHAFFTAARLDPSSADRLKDLAEFIFRTNLVLTDDIRRMAEYCFTRLQNIQLSDAYHQSTLLGDIAQRLGHLDAAANSYQQCLVLRSDDEFATGRLAEVLIEQGQTKQAMELVRSLPENNAFSLLRSILQARVLKARGQTEEAIQMLQEAQNYAGHEFVRRKCLVELIELLLATKQHDSAVETASHLLRDSGDADDARVWLIRSQAAAGKLEDAISGLLKIRDASRLLPSLVTEISAVATAQNRRGELNNIIKSVSGESCQFLLSELFTAADLAAANNVPAATQVLARAAVLQPEQSVFWDYLIELRQSSAKRSGANHTADDGTRITNIGTELDNTDSHEKLSTAIEEAFEEWKLVPSDSSRIRHLITLHSWSESTKRDLVDPAIRLVNENPADAKSYHLLSIALRLAKRYDEAIAYEAAAFSLDQRPVYLIHAAYTRLKAGRINDAVNSLRLCERAGVSSAESGRHDLQLFEQMKRELWPDENLAALE